ncbi:hypothetical protein LguiB_002465 [Lonicera macranthoides]
MSPSKQTQKKIYVKFQKQHDAVLQSTSCSILEFHFHSKFKQSLRFLHQLRAQSEHQNTKLHLIKRIITVHIPFSDHPQKLIITQILKPKN